MEKARRLGGWSSAMAVALSILGGSTAHAAARPQAISAAKPVGEATERPNLVVIMADDIGFSDIGAYGGDIDTPNLDRLAQRSMRFTNFYNMSRCCPSRAALLTGRYPHRVNMAGNGTSLSLDVPTVAEELNTAGYATAMVGKWHLTAATPLPDRAEHLKWLNHQAYRDRDFGDRRTYPAARGFEHHWGIIWGVADYYDPFSLVDDFTPVRNVPKGFYLTDAISDHAVASVRTMARGRKPFLLYLAYTAAHWPLMAPEAVIRKYLPRYQDGWDAMRRRRHARQVRLGLISPDAELPSLTTGYEGNADTPWSKLTPTERALQVRKMATHAAMIDIMDRGIGRVMAELKRSGRDRNTAIMFLVDNGASPEIMTQPGYDRPSETRDGRPVRYGEYPAARIGSDETMAGIGTQWASAANTPWRWWKREQYEGGVRTPFLFSWPGHMGPREGSWVRDVAHVTDVTPTLLALARTAPHLAGKPPIDGISIAGALQGDRIVRPRPIFFEHYGARGVLDGRWKLVSLAPEQRGAYRPWRLYDLAADPTELHDLVAAHPDVARRLAAAWGAWAREVDAPARSEPGMSDGLDS